MSSSIVDHVVELGRRIADLERRNRNRRRTGVVTEVDHAKGLARVKFSEKPKPYLSPWVPWQEIAAGGIKTHIPPTVGEQVDVVSESGDLTDGIIEMSTPSDKNPRPHDGPELVIVRGDARFEMGDTFVRGKFKDARFVASDKAAKIRKGDSWVVADGNGVIVSHEPVVGADPDPN
ncbi:Phage-related baseplate assembly protein V [Nitrobacter hamburgensis X14]|uniref:Phage-related baseplate assembly protein V n=1 Tax=Nitrobacter hamburgensis (strain DSM 10229 / NCIMB 13809 / X14) TaxID=323097 RepID=Q1QI82_NITHX|nr:phage baseplate assembly protein V [Nitrobacter hamburgensis]ABE64065.1 Phage-related baseplate assembly protein V [Nitrobacter hamburgensis X14]